MAFKYKFVLFCSFGAELPDIKGCSVTWTCSSRFFQKVFLFFSFLVIVGEDFLRAIFVVQMDL